MKYLIIKVISIVLLLISFNSYGQLNNSNWYFSQFGNGLNFNGPTNILYNGATESIEAYTTTMSDSSGKLLFYTDGHSVWNKNHVKMPNGNNSLNGMFHQVVIVPFPANENKYYIFTINPDTFGQQDDYFYSVVNLTLQNGLGDVETLNADLNILPRVINGDIKSVIERPNNMTVAKHADGSSYWLILNPFDNFISLKIDNNGISSNLVISDEYGNGDPAPFVYGSTYRGRSGMNISPDMEKVAYYTYNTNFLCYYLKIYNFDNLTGQFTFNYFGNCIHTIGAGWSAEFSSDSRFLYILNDTGGTTYRLYQFDTENTNNTPILLGDFTGSYYNNRTIQRAIDNKIYVPNGGSTLGVINSPNTLGTGCNFVEGQIDFSTGNTTILPQNIQYHEDDCIEYLIITETVYSGNSDIREAAAIITASNIIETGAIAEYKAGTSVKLVPSFHAQAGSNFRAYIGDCSLIYYRSSQTIKNDESDFEEIKLFPNPAKQELNIKTNIIKTKSLTMYNLSGQVVLSNSIEVNSYTLDVSNFSRGYYILRIELASGEITFRKLILE